MQSILCSQEDISAVYTPMGGAGMHLCLESNLLVSIRVEPGSKCLSARGQAHLSHVHSNTHTYAFCYMAICKNVTGDSDTFFDRIYVFCFSYRSYSYQDLCAPSHKSSYGSLNTSVVIVTSHSCDFSYNQSCMVMLPALRTEQPYARSHTQTVKDNLAQVVQSNLGSEPWHICSLLLSTQ